MAWIVRLIHWLVCLAHCVRRAAEICCRVSLVWHSPVRREAYMKASLGPVIN
jgi:hypothetical protein